MLKSPLQNMIKIKKVMGLVLISVHFGPLSNILSHETTLEFRFDSCLRIGPVHGLVKA